MLRMLSGVAGNGRRQPRAERLSGDGLRAWAQCLDLRGKDRRVHPGRTGLGGDGRHQRLKGPLHGGAPGPVLDMLDAIGEAGKAEAWLQQALARGDRLMGFGHRIYRVRDPRADALKAALRPLGAAGAQAAAWRSPSTSRKAALDMLHKEKPGRPLETNVEFYTAVLLDALGFPADSFTCVFVAGRMPGWIAHAREQETSGRLIRPQSRYVGPAPQQAA